MRIGIDIDDTITDTFESLVPYAYKYNEKLGNKKVPDFTKSRYQDVFGWTDEQFFEFFGLYVPIVLEHNTPKEDFVKYINLLGKDNEIIFITARSNMCFDNPYEFSYNWLVKNNIKFDKLLVSCQNKKTICEQEKIDVFIDDNIGHCRDVSTLNTKVLLFDSRLNKLDKNHIRVSSWKEVYDYIGGIKCG